VWSKQLPHDDQHSHEKGFMKCIWHGNMEFFDHILKFRAILENAHTWAMRELKGRLSDGVTQGPGLLCQFYGIRSEAKRRKHGIWTLFHVQWR
jgi:hypothetical protein